MQQIADQLIELGKNNASSDNISVIVVFLKDPHQIVAEYKSVDASQVTRMDFESTNGLHHLDDCVVHHDETTPSPDKMHVDFNKVADVQHHDHDAMEANDFYFGKLGSGVGIGGDGEFLAANVVNTIPSNVTSNGDDGDKFASSELHGSRSVDDDFGPETDVDATDDNAISPLSPSVSFPPFFSIDFLFRLNLVLCLYCLSV